MNRPRWMGPVLLGPVGYLYYALLGDLPWRAGWRNVANYLIWWIPFARILWLARVRS